MLISVFLASCDLTAAALGVCGCATEVGDQIGFQLCAEQKVTQQVGSGVATQTPMRYCEYYVNGSIDQETIGRIRSWVAVGSRYCIGDEIPESQPIRRTVTDDIKDVFSAYSGRPQATWIPGGELEVEVIATFLARATELSVSGELLGNPATIRFVPAAIRWEFSDGESGGGESYERSFSEVGSYTARAVIEYRIDYRYSGSSWVVGASSGELSSNSLAIEVIKIPRRTLLVDP